MTTAQIAVLPTPGFATMVTALPVPEVRGVFATGGRYLVGAVELMFVGLLVPLAIVVVGTPIVLVVRGLIALASRF